MDRGPSKVDQAMACEFNGKRGRGAGRRAKLPIMGGVRYLAWPCLRWRTPDPSGKSLGGWETWRARDDSG